VQRRSERREHLAHPLHAATWGAEKPQRGVMRI
jgi:hypothetical protein